MADVPNFSRSYNNYFCLGILNNTITWKKIHSNTSYERHNNTMKQFSVTHHLTSPPPPNVTLQYSLFHLMAYFILLDSDTDSNLDCKSNVHNVLCRTFYTALSQNRIPSLTANYMNGIRIGIRICECKQAITNTKTVVLCRVSVNQAKFVLLN